MINAKTYMNRDIEEIPAVLERLLASFDDQIAPAANYLKNLDPMLFITVARGSSDHAATYIKYAIELISGIPVASIGPSVTSIYQSNLKLNRGICLAISQSGQSPDIIKMKTAAANGGAKTIVFTNHIDSPLSKDSDFVIDICSGPEISVAATKTFVASIVAGLLLIAHWRNDIKLMNALKQLPDQLMAAIRYCNWSSLAEKIKQNGSLFVIGRGPGMAIADEIALKFQETCGIHALSYSSAELMHGPISIIKKDFPVLILTVPDSAEESLIKTSETLKKIGAQVFVTSNKTNNSNTLPFITTNHPLTNPLALIVSLYKFIESFSCKIGLNPDIPNNLRKVTQTT